MIKILVIGNSDVGKTQFINRFTNNTYDKDKKVTIACDWSMKILQIDGEEIRMQMWDLLGYDSSFRSMNRTFCKDAHGAIVVADSMHEESIYNTVNWKQNVNDIL